MNTLPLTDTGWRRSEIEGTAKAGDIHEARTVVEAVEEPFEIVVPNRVQCGLARRPATEGRNVVVEPTTLVLRDDLLAEVGHFRVVEQVRGRCETGAAVSLHGFVELAARLSDLGRTN
jgi:hypothetical protein